MSSYQKSVVAILAFLQFTVVLDFMILSPLGALLMRDLSIGTTEFGLVVSGYAFAAAASGVLTAGFADRFDRKKLLLFFYTGFIGGTVFCGLAPTFELLLAARIITGLFGGVLSGTSMAIIADLFPLSMRGRVMGVVQSAFSASSVLGIPAGLALSAKWGWHAPFLLIALVGAVVGVFIFMVLRPIDGHLHTKSERNPLSHLLQTATTPNYLRGFSATVLLATGGFMLAPYSSAFMVQNVKIAVEDLPFIYIVSGACTFFVGPAIGRLGDAIGMFRIYVVGCIVSGIVVVGYAHLPPSPVWVMTLVSAVLGIAINSRIVTSGAIVSGVPEPQDRGAYMALNASIQQVSGGIAAAVGGLIVVQGVDGHIERFDVLAGIVAVAGFVTLIPMAVINKLVKAKRAASPV